MDALLLALQNVSAQLLPILGAVVLIFLCISLKKLSILIVELTEFVKKLDPTVRLIDQSIEKVQAPLDTAVKLSHSVDKIHDKTAETFGKAATFATENIDQIKGYVQNKMNIVELEQSEEKE